MGALFSCIGGSVISSIEESLIASIEQSLISSICESLGPCTVVRLVIMFCFNGET